MHEFRPCLEGKQLGYQELETKFRETENHELVPPK